MAAMNGIPFIGLLVLSFLKVTLLFNLDFQYPIVFEDPTLQPGRETYFGYSVLLYSSTTNKSWIMVGAPRANSTFVKHKQIIEPGVVYKCPFWPAQKCEPLLLDRTGNDKYTYSKPFFWDLKDGAWIGAAMDVQPGPGGRVVICGHRWINQYFIYEREDYYTLGVCYWIEAEDDDNEKPATKLLPLLNNGRIVKELGRNTIFDFGVGQCGISTHMPLKKHYDESSELLLGAPGILNWRGGTILYEDNDSSLGSDGINKRSARYGAFSRYYVPPATPSPDNHLKEFDYFGYQVTSGYFFDENELWYATSAPRATNILGKVLLYRVKKKIQRFDSFIMVDKNHQVMGIQCGEYFGASIAVGNLNDDEYDDLIVGAPLYTSEGITRSDTGLGYEEGRISVFFGTKTKNMREVAIYGKTRGARFGSAVSYLGDLDSDGLGEIAVGSPYENEGRGVVYIYSGSRNGIITKPVQILSAHDTYPHLKGFGSSINPHSADIDGNGCKDVAVGAYKSGHAVVFRGRPVVRWKIATPHSKSRIPRNATHITLNRACVTYVGNSVPNELTIWRTLDMDPTYKRCHINNMMVFKEKLVLKRGIEHCDDIVISIKDSNKKNIIQPVEIRIKYQLEEEMLREEHGSDRTREDFQIHPVLVKADGNSGKDGFCKYCPISKESTEMLLSIPFEVGCGVDEICLADLHITGLLPQLSISESTEEPSFVIGSDKTMKLSIHVSNKGEPAYLTQVYIILGSPAKIARIPPECHEILQLPNTEITPDTKGNPPTSTGNVSQLDLETHSNDSVVKETIPNSRKNEIFIYIRCGLDNPLPTNSARELMVELDMKNVYDSQGMNLYAYVTTVSNESNPLDNIWGTNIPFIYKADMEIIGRAGKKDLFTYFKENKNESESRIMFHHIYEVQKHGQSPVEKINIIFNIPQFIEGNGFNSKINFLQLISIEGSQNGQSFPCSVLDDDTENTQDDEFNSRHDKEFYEDLVIRLTSNYSTTQVPSNRTLYLNCSSMAERGEQKVKCISVSCAAGPFENLQTSAKVLLEMELDVLSLEKVMGLRDIILLETQGSLKVVEPAGLIQPKNDKADISWASTRFIGDIPKKHVESWVLALAIGGGIMLLFFVAMAMHKAGFFERKKKQELKSLKRKTLAEYATNANEEQEIDQSIEE